MKFINLLLIGLTALPVFSQTLKKEPVATPAPFELQKNIDLSTVTQTLSKAITTGDTTFYIRKNLRDSEVDLISVEFYKLFENEELVVYAEVAEYDEGRVNDVTVEKIVNSLLYETPGGSVNPNQGILTNLTNLFGAVPDVDNNGKMFVLLIDARDDYDEGGSDTYVAGYFDPIDQMKSKGNYSDIIYIDTNPAESASLYTLGVVAHELQHLIHYNYDTDESTWLNEGFSELAPKILGYDAHAYSKFLQNTNRKLAEFDGSLNDYAKVGLWSFYLYKRFGIALIREILMNSANSTLSVEYSLENLGHELSFKEVLNDWFIANYLNDIILDNGKYSYFGELIPAVESEYYHANFTEGRIIHGTLKPQAAVYIQFNSGKNINLEINIEQHSLAKLMLVRHKINNEVDFIDISSGNYKLEDLTFGNDYEKMGLILSWTANLDNSQNLDFSYSAVGVGGFEELELIHDNDSISFYISLAATNIAAERFSTEKEAEITAVKFNCGTSNPVNISIYSSLDRNPVKTFTNVPCNDQEWTTFNLEEPIKVDENTDYYVSLTSANYNNLSLGYSETGNGKDYSYLNSGSGFYDLDNFSVDDGDSYLEGNWMIRSTIRRELFLEPELVLDPDTLFVAVDDTATLVVQNKGTEALIWTISSLPAFIDVSPTEGILNSGKFYLNLTPKSDDFFPGLYSENLVINSNANRDSVNIIFIKNNPEKPQTAFILPTDKFEQNLIRMKVFNIGAGEGNFEIRNLPAFMGASPSNGDVVDDDTVMVDLMIDSMMVDRRSFAFIFNNDVFDEPVTLHYTGRLPEDFQDRMKLYPPAPNPFVVNKDNQTKIMVRLHKPQIAQLKIFNIRGEIVKKFNFDNYSQGIHLFHWDGITEAGKFASSGLYFLYLEQSDNRKVQKLLLIK